jgi:glycosyltransferase involved in cell wall biosynthesis
MKVAIVHPWLPQYRVPFFEQLVADGLSLGIEIHIFHGEPPPEWSLRGDANRHDSFTQLPTTFFPPRGRSFSLKRLHLLNSRGPWDLVILEQAVRNLETYRLLLSRTPLAFWGHGKTYTKRVSRQQEMLKQWITRRGQWFFAYTRGGELAVASAGFPAEKITVLQNTIDSNQLIGDIAEVKESDLDAFRKRYDLAGPTALFMGGLDGSKRLGFLLSSMERVSRALPAFRLLVAGDGSERPIIEEAARKNPQVTYLGRLTGREKALVMAASDVLVMPGRVGLLAVDSFAAGLPIITTRWPWHAPEFEYLKDELNAVITNDDEKDFADGLLAVFTEDGKLDRLREACRDSSSAYTVEEMSRRFIQGIQSALAATGRRNRDRAPS